MQLWRYNGSPLFTKEEIVKHRNSRQDAIREIIRGKSIKTQRALVDELKAMGFNCTQATVSRDISDMGLRKLPEGVYVLSEDLHLQRMLAEFVNEVMRAENLLLGASPMRSVRSRAMTRSSWWSNRPATPSSSRPSSRSS